MDRWTICLIYPKRRGRGIRKFLAEWGLRSAKARNTVATHAAAAYPRRFGQYAIESFPFPHLRQFCGDRD
jgi:hypothetical protein